MPNWKKLIVSGSDASLNSLNVNTNVVADSFTGSLNISDSDTLGIGSQTFFPQGTNGFSVNEDFDPSNSSTQTAYHFTSGQGRETVAFTLARTGQFTDGFGIYGTSADNTLVMFGEQNNTSFEWRRGVGIRPLDLDGGTLLASLSPAGEFNVIGGITGSSFTGSFVGDGSGLTNVNANISEVATVSDTFTSTTSKSVNHSFGTKDVIVTVYNDSDQQIIPATVTTTDINNVTVTFDNATTGRIVIAKGGHIVSGSIVNVDEIATVEDTFTSVTSKTVAHTFGTKNVFVTVYNDSDDQIIPARVNTPTTGSVTVEFDSATSGRIVIGKAGHIVTGSSAAIWTNISEKPAGLISGSSQLTGSFDIRYALSGSGVTDFNQLINVPSGLISGSSQVEFNDISNTPFSQSTGAVTTTKSILPETGDLDLGSPTQQFRHLYLSSASLYMDGQKILSSDAQTLTFTTDVGQSIKFLETGADDITLQTDTGNIELKGTVEILSGKKIVDSAATKVLFGDSVGITGSIDLTGTVDGVDVAQLKSDFDTLEGKTLISGSTQVDYTALQNIPTNIFSGSFNDIPNNPFISSSGAISASGHLVPISNETYDLGSATQRWRDLYLSGSTVYLGETKITRTTDGDVEFRDRQTDSLRKIRVEELEIGTGATARKIQVDNSGRIKFATTLDEDKTIEALGFTGIVTSSAQLSFDEIPGIPSGLVSGSGQVVISDTSGYSTLVSNLQTYADNKVAGIVDSAPTTLNTLNELAAALGDDANFSTTISTTIGEKLAKASNLSDLTNAGTARTNLGLGTAATTAATDYATAAQGTKADTAHGWGNHASAGYLTSLGTALVDADFTSNGLMKRTGAGTYSIITDNSSNWNTAYGWGNHASAGYLTSGTGLDVDTVDGQHAQEMSWGHQYVHSTFTNFNSFLNTNYFGAHFVQGSTNSPGHSGATQYYHQRMSLGSEYNNYSLQFAIPRNRTDSYLYYRNEEAGSASAWYKMRAGYADDAGTLGGKTWDSSGKNLRGTEIYADNWFRNYNANEGLYNEATAMHWYSTQAGRFRLYSTTTFTEIEFATANGTNRGYVYADTAPSIGFLNNNHEWGLRYLTTNGYSPNLYFLEEGNETWSGNPGNDQGKVEYHSNRMYIVAGANSTEVVRFRRSSDDVAMIDNSGNVTFQGDVTGYSDPSDIRLKENVEIIDNALDKVKSLSGITFNYKKDGGRSTGVIAQEVEKVLPEAIYTTKELNSEEEFLSVRYGNMVGLLVEAIKEQQVQIEELKALLKK